MKNLLIAYWYTYHHKLIWFILLLLMLNSCLSIKPSTTKSGKKYFETFYVGEEGTQYFINPISFKDIQNNEDLSLDITFRYKDEVKDSAVVNFSIKSSIIYKTIDSLEISNGEIRISSSQFALLFNEKNKKQFTSRYSTSFSLKEIKEIFNNHAWKITVYNQNSTTRYTSDKKANSAIKTIRERVFILM